MTSQSTLISLAAAGAAFSLLTCEATAGASPAGATVTREQVNPEYRPGATPAGAISGLRCTPGSGTARWPGIGA